jgi:hypothetical protein
VERKQSEIETLDSRRMRYLELYLIGVSVFLVLSITRYFFRFGNLNARPIGIAVLAGLILSLGLMGFSTIQTAAFRREIKDDPALMDALNNELVQALERKSWKAAYFGAIGTTVFFAAVWFFYPVSDPVLVALTSIIAGAGAYHATFYVQYRSS